MGHVNRKGRIDETGGKSGYLKGREGWFAPAHSRVSSKLSFSPSFSLVFPVAPNFQNRFNGLRVLSQSNSTSKLHWHWIHSYTG